MWIAHNFVDGSYFTVSFIPHLAGFIVILIISLCCLRIRNQKGKLGWLRTIPTDSVGKDGTHREAIAAEPSLNPYLRKLHDKYGSIVYAIPEIGKPVVSIADPAFIEMLVEVGSRPTQIWRFAEDFLGVNNLQVLCFR